MKLASLIAAAAVVWLASFTLGAQQAPMDGPQ